MIKKIVKHELFLPALLAGGIFIYHLLTAFFSEYGYFIDELYYIACSKHPAFGYVDHPPLSILLLSLQRLLFGDSLLSVRFLSALASGGTVFMTAILARALGGTRRAMIIATLAAVSMPVLIVMGSFYSMNAFEPFLWSLILYYVIRMVNEQRPSYWLLIGVLMGIGLEMKHTMILYTAALIAGMIAAPSRKFLWNKWFFIGAGAAFLLLLPNIVWQAVNGFPSLEFYRNAMMNKNIPRGPLAVLIDQILFVNPFTLPLWLAGLWYLFFHHDGKQFRFFGTAYLLLLFVMIAGQSSRPDRITAMYPLLVAAGAIAVEKFHIHALLFRKFIFASSILLLTAGTVIAAPIFSPVLSPSALKQYLASIGLSFDLETGKMNEPIPQWLADRLGWKELASATAEVFNSLSAEEQQRTLLLSTNYGEAGALELYSKEFGLPPLFATHNSYHQWGPPPDSIRTFIVVYAPRRDLERMFDTVVEAKIHRCDDCTRPQRIIPIYIVRGPRFSMSAEWKRFKIYN